MSAAKSTLVRCSAFVFAPCFSYTRHNSGMQKGRSRRNGTETTKPSSTQLLPKRNVLCLRVLSTASRKMPPNATFAPRL